ncbi:MAG: Yip1 family protein [Bacteroidota bacterium]
MNEIPVTPAPEPTPEPGSASVFQIWTRALTKPSEFTYADLAASPRAKATTAYLWMFVAALIQFFLSALVQRQMMNNFQQYGLNLNQFGTRGGFGAILVGLICVAPLLAALSTLMFAIVTAIMQWLARMFGGTGTYDQLAYVLAAIAAPLTILGGILGLFSAIPYAGLCFGLLGFLVGLYILVLQVMAIKGVNHMGWGGALGAYFIPVLVIAFLCSCLFGISIAALIPIIRQSVPGFPR